MSENESKESEGERAGEDESKGGEVGGGGVCGGGGQTPLPMGPCVSV